MTHEDALKVCAHFPEKAKQETYMKCLSYLESQGHIHFRATSTVAFVKGDELMDPQSAKVQLNGGARARNITQQSAGRENSKGNSRHPASFSFYRFEEHGGNQEWVCVFEKGDLLELDEKAQLPVLVELLVLEHFFSEGKHQHMNGDGTPVFTPGMTLEEQARILVSQLTGLDVPASVTLDELVALLFDTKGRRALKMDITSFDGNQAAFAQIIREEMLALIKELVVGLPQADTISMQALVKQYELVLLGQFLIGISAKDADANLNGLEIANRSSGTGATSFANQLCVYLMIMTSVLGDSLSKVGKKHDAERFRAMALWKRIVVFCAGDDCSVIFPDIMWGVHEHSSEDAHGRLYGRRNKWKLPEEYFFGRTHIDLFTASVRRLQRWSPFPVSRTDLSHLKAACAEHLQVEEVFDKFSAVGLTTVIEGISTMWHGLDFCRARVVIRRFPDGKYGWMLAKHPLPLIKRLTTIPKFACARKEWREYVSSVATSFRHVYWGLPVHGRVHNIIGGGKEDIATLTYVPWSLQMEKPVVKALLGARPDQLCRRVYDQAFSCEAEELRLDVLKQKNLELLLEEMAVEHSTIISHYEPEVGRKLMSKAVYPWPYSSSPPWLESFLDGWVVGEGFNSSRVIENWKRILHEGLFEWLDAYGTSYSMNPAAVRAVAKQVSEFGLV